MLTVNQSQMVYWIKERDNIRIKKEAGELAPWSTEKVMQETYFCNVNREDDNVTKWIRDNWKYGTSIDDFGDEIPTETSYDFAMIVARIFNLPVTLNMLMQPIDDNLYLWLQNAKDILQHRHDKGQKIWNGAYIISTNGRKIDKRTHCLELLEKVAEAPQITHNCQTLKEAHTELMKVDGLASFLAAQVVADLKNSEGHPLQSAPDWKTFSAFGPGSLRGLEWFWEEKVTAKNYEEKIQAAYDILEYELPESILNILCMQNLQNCFCEYDKFMRVDLGTGRSKRKYNGTGEQK